MRHLLLPLFLFSATAHAFSSGQEVACGQRLGTVDELFSSGSMVVHFTRSYEESVPLKDDSREVMEPGDCVARLPDTGATLGGYRLHDTVLCQGKEGMVTKLFDADWMEVHFTASFEDGDRSADDDLFLVQSSDCERRVAP